MKSQSLLTVLILVLLTGLSASALADDPPFGSWATPVDGATVSGSVPITGWALDDVGVASVEIWRDPVAGEGSTAILMGEAQLIEGARPDVAAAYPSYPNNTRAGWGYMLLTTMLPDGGNGSYVFRAVLSDTDQQKTILGPVTIHVDNANAVLPFGNIDTPGMGETVSGSLQVTGWVLTPQPNTIPTDGSTIHLYVDGVDMGSPIYNLYRKDIATLQPGYSNSNGAGFFYTLDTEQYGDGVHTLQIVANDDAGNANGIGARYFSIDNSNTAVTTEIGRPKSFELSAPYPNPFNNETVLTFRLDEPMPVSIEVCDVMGRVLTRQDLGVLAAGEHSQHWQGAGLSSGLYFCRLQAGDQMAVKKMLLQK